jgi:hypothetical protein
VLEGVKALEGLEECILNDVLDFSSIASVIANHREQSVLVALDEQLKRQLLTFERLPN